MINVSFNNEQWIKAASFYLRTLVFVQEQGISPKAEFDVYDSDRTNYLVIFHNHIPIATGRYQQDDLYTVHPDRVCVKKEWRKKGVGRRVILELEHQGKLNKCQLSRIHGEKQAIPFYKKLGYSVVSDEFIEDGIICVKLEKKLY
ncbi:MAG: GNAT family N-acetyltransferase [Vagococcus sp.]